MTIRPITAAALLLAAACSIPNLESPECQAARTPVREFYSFHFGNDMAFTPENLGAREKFLTREFAGRLKTVEGSVDPFTQTPASDPPKAFRVGECSTIEPGRSAAFEVLLFWKTDDRSEQKKITATAVYEDDAWRISLD